MDLIQIQPTGKSSIKNSIPVFIITKEGKPYNQKGIEFIKNELKEHFGINTDLAIYTSISINEPTVLAKFIQTVKNPYVVLSHKDGIGFFPSNANSEICNNLIESHAEWPNMTSWQIIMKTSGLAIY